MILTVTPDKEGFADAQRRLRDKLGMDVTFYGPVAAIYDPDVPLDPETGAPHDPTIQPTASAAASSIVRCSIVQRPFALPQVKGADSAEGWGSHNDVGLIMDAADGVRLGSAVAFGYADHLFTIRTTMFDGIGDIQRWVVHGERQS